MSERSYFVSDLHMFSRRSHSGRHEEDIRNAAANAHTFVLGGDIFDFCWSTLPTVDDTICAAIDWLDNLVTDHAQCEFHFVLGNHDFNRRFVDRLDQLAKDKPNLSWHDYYVRLGQSLFLHGDVADRKMTHEKLVQIRSRWQEDEQRPHFRHLLYDAVVHLRLHRLATKYVHPHHRVVERLLIYLDDIGHGPDSGLRNVYFGHTHSAMQDYEHAGLRFHNGGAPIKGLKFRIVEADL